MTKAALITHWCLCLLLQAATASAWQQLPDAAAMEQLAETLEEDIENDEAVQQQQFLLRQPLQLNRVGEAELLATGLFSAEQAVNLVAYRQLFGPLASKYELQAVPGWDIMFIRKVFPLVTVGPGTETQEKPAGLLLKGQHQLLLRTGATVQKAKGFLADSAGNKPYGGSALKQYIRYSYQYKQQLWYGVTAEKDAGEKWGDFTGFHFLLKRNGWLRSVALGDYTINMGQGLVCWQGLAFGKTGEAIAVYRRGNTLQAYRSAGESNFHRGVAVESGGRKWDLLLFASGRKRTANMLDDSAGAAPRFSSISPSGYHRTASELNDRNRVMEYTAGAQWQYHTPRLRLGISVITSHFSAAYQPRETLYNLYTWRGRSLLNASLHYSYSIRNFFMFGETAWSPSGLAGIYSLVISGSSRFEWNVVGRYFQPGYQSLYGNAFGENSRPSNEQGLYTGWKWQATPAWTLQGYADLFRFPWLKYRVSAPGSGYEWSQTITYTRRRRWEAYLRCRIGNKERDAADSTIAYPVMQHRVQARLHLERLWKTTFSTSLRLEKNWLLEEGNHSGGWSVFGDIQQKSARTGLQLAARLLYFRTDGYDTRVYAYERDLLYSFSIPAVYGHGWRYYLQCQGRAIRFHLVRDCRLQWWLRWSNTRYADRNESGSGNDRISGKSKSEWRVQVLLLW